MVKKLFSRFLLSAFMLAGVVGTQYVMAQSTTITTTFNNSPGHTVVTNVNAPQFITFTVTNNNVCPITITELEWWHVGLGTYGTGPVYTHSMNGARYTLWRSSSSLTGAPNVQAPNWVVEGVSDTINNGTSAGSFVPLFNNSLNVSIPPATTYRFALAATDTVSFFRNVNPFTFVQNGVTVNVSPAVSFWGLMPGPGQNNVNGNTPHFCGRVIFTNAGNAAPAAPVVTSTSLKPCKGSSPTLTATVPAYITNPEFEWRDNNGNIVSGATGSTYTIVNIQPSQSGTWTVKVRNPNCGTAYSFAGSVKLDVQNPGPPQIDGKTEFCLNEPFVPVTVLGTNPKWYYSSSGGSPIPFVPPFNTTTVNEDTFFVSQTVLGCESELRTKVHYKSSAKPAPPIVTSPLFYCENSPASQLTAIGSQLKWYYDPIGGISSVIAPTPNTTAKDTFEYYVTQSNRGCESNRSRINVIVTFKPNGLVLATKDKLCQNDTLTLNYYGSAFPGSAYNWTFPVGTTLLQNDANFAGPIQIKLDSAGIRNIELQVGNGGCYSDLIVKPIRVDTLPTGIIALRPNICVGQTELISLNSYTISTDSFFWTWDGGATSFFSTDQGPYGVTWNTPGEKTVRVRLVNKLCSNTMSAKTFVNPKPDASFKVDGWAANKMFCSGDSVRMTANTIVPSSKYSWTPTRFFDNYSDLPNTYSRLDFSTTIALRVEDEYGCFNTDSMKVMTKGCCEVRFPSAFSPNSDGKNDLFRMIPRPGGEQRNLDLRSLKVVNRYGQIVFETADERRGWDGTLNGKPQDMGSYFYYINYRCDGKILEEKGEFILVR
ncbi:hypothetical protein CAP35_09190 [Chitinophagaceae bacterium IBVUCB1]|nr:hypothetical protein CAP35_09190 [Chitinophagaceae bacterium IBVUCB1]